MKRTAIATIGLLLIFLFSIAESANLYNFQGKLTDKTGKAITTKTKITFRIYKTATGGTPLWTEHKEVAPDSQGLMGAKLGETSSINLAPGKYYLEVQIGNETMTPRHIDDFSPPPFPTGVPLPGEKAVRLGTFSSGELARMAAERVREKYTNFLRGNPNIRNAIVWQNFGSDEHLYHYDSDWSPAMKEMLFQFLIIYETGGAYPYNEPPVPQAGSDDYTTILSQYDGWHLYLANIAFSLFVEANRLVPWRITSYTSEQLAILFDNYEIFSHGDFDLRFRMATAWNPKYCYDFLVARNMIKENQTLTVYALTDWTRKYLRHIKAEDPPLHTIYEYNGAPPIDKILTPRYSDTRFIWQSIIYGCHGTTAVFKSVLRSINIPVKEGSFPETRAGGWHSRAVFPTVGGGTGIIHSDDLQSAKSFGLYYIPNDVLFLGRTELELYSSPPLSEEQMFRNYFRHYALIDHDYPSDRIIIRRCDELEGRSTLIPLLQDLYDQGLTETEARETVYRINAIIESYGGPSEFRRASIRYLRDLHSTPP
ncbi:hypothetical protein HZC35_01325 [Candidatus Saganbacteria bacterium]|nr:hypothetical protein [Candidatus Saganbacteria bacterium]